MPSTNTLYKYVSIFHGMLYDQLHTVYHESFEAKNLRGQCITQIFTKKLFPQSIKISARFSIATDIFMEKSFAEHQKTAKTAKLSWYTVLNFI